MSDVLLAVQGRLQEVMKDRTRAFLQGQKNGLTKSVDMTKTEMRRDVEQAGFNRRLATTLRGEVYPRNPQLAYEPTGEVFSKAPKILAGLTDGGIRRPSIADSLIVPTEVGKSFNISNFRQKGESMIEAFKRRFNPMELVTVKRPGKTSLIVAKMRANDVGDIYFRELTNSGRSADREDNRRDTFDKIVYVPVFTLTKQTQAEKRLNLRKIMSAASKRHPTLIIDAIRTEFKASEDRTGRR